MFFLTIIELPSGFMSVTFMVIDTNSWKRDTVSEPLITAFFPFYLTKLLVFFWSVEARDTQDTAMFHLTRNIITKSSLLMRNSLQCNDDCLPLLKIQCISLWDRLPAIRRWVKTCNKLWKFTSRRKKKQIMSRKFIPC